MKKWIREQYIRALDGSRWFVSSSSWLVPNSVRRSIFAEEQQQQHRRGHFRTLVLKIISTSELTLLRPPAQTEACSCHEMNDLKTIFVVSAQRSPVFASVTMLCSSTRIAMSSLRRTREMATLHWPCVNAPWQSCFCRSRDVPSKSTLSSVWPCARLNVIAYASLNGN